MANVKTRFECQSCGHVEAKWTGKCPSCDSWNSFVEVKAPKKVKQERASQPSQMKALSEITTSVQDRIVTEIVEFDRVVGGGFVNGSVLVIGGAPGIGKSTLTLQLGAALGGQGTGAVYIAGEESPQQIKLRADRMGLSDANLNISTDIELNRIVDMVETDHPPLVIVDSIQTIYDSALDSVPGSVGQLRECTFRLIQAAKSTGTVMIIIGHITKDGQIAGPKIIEHMVDTVLYFEGDTYSNLRVLRTVKNRFGPTHEIGFFNMTEAGLMESAEHAFVMSDEDLSGTAVSCVREGTRNLIVEVQALVSRATFGTPQRVTNGYDQKRVAVIIAVLEKRHGLFLGDQDIFVKVTGALKVNDPAMDLAITVAIWSAFTGKPIRHTDCFIGELALTGKIQPVQMMSERLNTARHYGLTTVFAAAETPAPVTSIDDLFDRISG